MTLTTTQQKAIDAYAKILRAELDLDVEYQNKLQKLQEQRETVGRYLEENVTDVADIPEIIKSEVPAFAWKIGIKNDASGIECYRTLRDFVAASTKKAEEFKEVNDAEKDKIGNWLLASLNAAGANSVNCGASGKAYKKTKVQASPTDWDSFLKWAVKEEAFDAVQRRVSSTFVKKYEDDHKEAPPFLNIYREFEVVVTK